MSNVSNRLKCSKEFLTARGLRKHLQNYPGHKQESSIALPAATAAKEFLNVATHHRTARLKELLKLLTPEDCATLLLPEVAKVVPTSTFLFTKCWQAGENLSESKLRSELEVLMKTLAEKYPDVFVYSLKQPSVSSLSFPSENICVSKNFTTLPQNGQQNYKHYVKFIDDLAAPQPIVPELSRNTVNLEEVSFNQKERAKLSEFVLCYKNGEFFKDIHMPLVFKQHYKESVKFVSGLVGNFNIGQNKYQNIVRNQGKGKSCRLLLELTSWFLKMT